MQTNGKSYRIFKYSFEGNDVLTFDYDDYRQITWERYGEIVPPISMEFSNMKPLADKLLESTLLFTYFLDGSRRTYKVDDISYKNQVYPVVTGQVGISCCKRENKVMRNHSTIAFLGLWE